MNLNVKADLKPLLALSKDFVTLPAGMSVDG